MTGKINSSFHELYKKQRHFQMYIEGRYPVDDPKLFQYHMTAMTEELGEVLKADKRWKTHRNKAYNPEEKLEEIADMFITAMNIAMWSGFTSEELSKAISDKIDRNSERLK